MLTGFHPDFGYQEQNFTKNEFYTAVHIARQWARQGLEPRLYIKTATSIKRVQIDSNKSIAA